MKNFVHKQWTSIFCMQIGIILFIILIGFMNLTTATNASFTDTEAAFGTITAGTWEIEKEKADPVIEDKQKTSEKEEKPKNNKQTETKEVKKDKTGVTKDQTAATEKETTKKDREAEESINNEPIDDKQSTEKKQDEKVEGTKAQAPV